MVRAAFFIALSLALVVTAMAVDESKAIMDSSRKTGIILSPLARKNIGIKTTRFQLTDRLTLPESALVHTRDLTGIYVERQGWFKFIRVAVLSKNNNTITVTSKDLMNNEVIVLEGAALLRVSEMEAFSSEE